jgi:hypothetical protein
MKFAQAMRHKIQQLAKQTIQITTHPHMALCVALFCLLSGLYILSYDGASVSDDERFIFDSTESFVRRSNFDITYMFDLFAPTTSPSDPIPSAPQEPLQAILAAPLFAIAQVTPHIGLIHTVWLFNIFVTSGTAVALFWGGIVMGYSARVAWIIGLLFGIGTTAFPWSGTFFREPLAGFFLLIAFTSAWKISNAWGNDQTPSKASIVLLASIIGLIATKFVLIVVAPALLILFVPSYTILRKNARFIAILIACGMLTLLVVFGLGTAFGGSRFQIDYWKRLADGASWNYIDDSLVGYLFSPGRSVWLFSPLLLLGIAGSAILAQRREGRTVIAIWIGLLLTILSYGVWRGAIWWGGNSWGPRHLMPLTPVLMILVLPIFDKLSKGVRKRWYIITGAIIVVSIGVQLLGTLVSIDAYYDHLGQANVLVWEQGLWSWKWSPIPQHLDLLDINALDTAWRYSDHSASLIITITLALVVITLCTLWASGILFHRRLPGKFTDSVLSVCAPLLLALSMATGVYSMRDDPRYIVDMDAIPLIEALKGKLTRNDAVILQSSRFQYTFMNYFKESAPVITLPYAPGENYNPATDSVEMLTTPSQELLGVNSVNVINALAKSYENLWLVVDTTPGVHVELRPTERYMAENYYPVDEFQISNTARAIHFFGLEAPMSLTMLQDAYEFEDLVALLGFDLPDGTLYSAGDVVPVSLAWRPIQPLNKDYLFSVQIARQDMTPVAQRDGLPQGTFGYTSQWSIDETYHDNHGLQLPADLPPGDYVLQVIVYTYPELTRLTVNNQNGVDILMLQTITVQ